MKVNSDVSEERLKDLLCSALEGGSNYWYNIDNTDDAITTSPESVGVEYWHEVPFTKDGVIVIVTLDGDKIDDKKSWKLDRNAIESGLLKFASLKPGEGGHHWPNFLKEDDDAETGDVFLQCCLFGKVVFG